MFERAPCGPDTGGRHDNGPGPDRRGQRRILKAYTIVEKPGQRGFWLDIGVGNQNDDGLISVKLDALPVNGTILLREYEGRRDSSARPQQQLPTNGGR